MAGSDARELTSRGTVPAPPSSLIAVNAYLIWTTIVG